MTEVLTKQARRSHWHCFYAVLWLTYWWLYQRQMQKETAEGEVPLVWIKTQKFKIFNHPIFVSSDVHSSSHFECASDHMCFKCYNKRKKEKKAEAVRTILCRSIAPFLHACVCVCISSLWKESQRSSSCLHNQEHDSKDVEWNPSNNIVSVFLSSKWSKMYEMNSHTDKERKRERERPNMLVNIAVLLADVSLHRLEHFKTKKYLNQKILCFCIWLMCDVS